METFEAGYGSNQMMTSLLSCYKLLCTTITLRTASPILALLYILLYAICLSKCSTQPLSIILTKNTWQFNSAKTIFAFSSPPRLRRRAKLFMSCCRPYLVHQYSISPFPNLHLSGEIFTFKGVKS